MCRWKHGCIMFHSMPISRKRTQCEHGTHSKLVSPTRNGCSAAATDCALFLSAATNQDIPSIFHTYLSYSNDLNVSQCLYNLESSQGCSCNQQVPLHIPYTQRDSYWFSFGYAWKHRGVAFHSIIVNKNPPDRIRIKCGSAMWRWSVYRRRSCLSTTLL